MGNDIARRVGRPIDLEEYKGKSEGRTIYSKVHGCLRVWYCR